MARRIALVKMQAAGNDFIVVNDMRRCVPATAKTAKRLCHRQLGVGADGLILIQPAARRGISYRMRIFNSDGSEAEMCGNGARCAVKFAVEQKIAPKSHEFETGAGVISGQYISGSNIRVSLTPPAGLKRGMKVPTRSAGTVRGSFINTGVPHFVTYPARLDSVDVIAVGSEIRRHPLFAPRGTNVNFVRVRGKSALDVRTYERGVESETLACGTGATAAAVVSALTRDVKPPVSVKTSGGAVLVINFSADPAGGMACVTMQGPVEKIFDTSIAL